MSCGHPLSDSTPWEGEEASCVLLQPGKVLGLSESLPESVSSPASQVQLGLLRAAREAPACSSQQMTSRGPLSAEHKLKIQKMRGN